MTLVMKAAAVMAAAAAMAAGQSGGARTLLGTVSAFRAETVSIEVRGDKGGAETVKIGPQTTVRRIAPGEKDLSKAARIEVTELALGDRVLVSWVAGLEEARRIVVMGADEIAKKNEADKQDWLRRGLTGVVESVKGSEVVLKSRGLAGETVLTVAVAGKTSFRRYAPDSVKFSDALVSQLGEVKKGDQLRARGVKSADGLKVEAEEVVFGSFLTRAGTIVSVDEAAGMVKVKELETGKPFTIKVSKDSQVKRMPEMGGMMAGPGGGPGPSMRPGGGGPDLGQMLERMPGVGLGELKVGETVVASSTRGAVKDEMTAIMLLANAGRLIEMARARTQSQRDPLAMGGGMGMGGMSSSGGGLGGLELPGMMP